ncbi:GH32 C-terminal domain-containing protein [Natrinema salinisoli]|uniref:GH32 C-terminal domain-containing protein n=1 Tax=Natrinema salinisoli TaxID=2878535 RepID=UPI001CF0C0DC|nr:GH32 C-terminal domain-containing protein [Natrinema salinisoli]
MSDAPRIACLYLEQCSPRQRTAYDWARTADVGTVDLISMAAVRTGDVELDDYDVCWWHRNERLAITERVADCRESIEPFVRDGGGLLLSVHALAAVAAWGIDQVPPEHTGVDEPPGSGGYLRKSIYASHPLFDGLDGRRLLTHGPSRPAPFARYQELLPERADVLGSTVVDDADVPDEASLLSWAIGDGTVLGAGVALSFDGSPDADETDEFTETTTRLVENALGYLASSGSETGTNATTNPDSRPGSSDDLLTGRPKSADELAAHREALSSDPHRPRYHISPPANWLNDPNGLVEWNGRYHVFYQYNPGGPYHHAIHWGHAVSDDLVHWRDEPVALTPSPNGPDRSGCWSGCTVVDDGTPTLLYTGGRGRRQLPCLATAGDEELRTWTKHVENPVIESAPVDPPILETEHWEAEFRDHCIWSEDDRWYHVIGSGVQDVGGTALLYVADELTEWEYVGSLLVGDWEGAGDVWECPELLDLGEKRLLHVSNYDTVLYFLGELDLETGSFESDATGILDYGDFYAPQSMDLSDGRTLTWGWLPETRTAEAQWDAGWSGSLSVPRELTLAEDGTLRQRPADELVDRRADRLGTETVALEGPDAVSIADGRALELDLELDLADADAVELRLLETPDGEERTTVRYDGDSVAIDRTDSSLDPDAASEELSMPIDEPGPLSLRVFLDGSAIELFANERRCLTGRVYPTREDATGASLAAHEGAARVEWSCWEMGSAWE